MYSVFCCCWRESDVCFACKRKNSCAIEFEERREHFESCFLLSNVCFLYAREIVPNYGKVWEIQRLNDTTLHHILVISDIYSFSVSVFLILFISSSHSITSVHWTHVYNYNVSEDIETHISWQMLIKYKTMITIGQQYNQTLNAFVFLFVSSSSCRVRRAMKRTKSRSCHLRIWLENGIKN